jgi:hypothetical protein
MALSLRALFLAIRQLREGKEEAKRLRLHFVGTSYAQGTLAQMTIQPVAQEVDAGEMVAEQTGRIPYLQGLDLLQASDVILIIGSDDPGYSPSKIYPCILAGRPILAILHKDSSAGDIIRNCRAGQVITFGTGETPSVIAERILPMATRLLLEQRGTGPTTDWGAFEPYTAREMTRRQCGVFDAAVEQFRNPARVVLMKA